MPSVAGNTAPSVEPGALYRAVWRWHFYAGIVVAPFVIFLAITGSLYLWKPQYEAWRYRALLTVAPATGMVSADAQFAAATATHPDATAISFAPAFAADRTSETVLALPDGDVVSVFVNPHSGAVAGERRESQRLMTTLHDLHGTLLSGTAGQLVVELVASWALVLFLTGLYLWWPRPQFMVWGFLLPRLRAKGRTFWRDLHAVPAVWFSAATLFMLSTGLLWTKAAGGWYRTLSAAIGQGTPRASNAAVHHSELVGWAPPLRAGLAEKIDRLASAPADDPHAGHRRDALRQTAEQRPVSDAALPPSVSLDRVVAIAESRHVPHPYAITMPDGPTGVTGVLSDRNQPFNRTYLYLDRYSGKVLADVRYPAFGYLAKFFTWGIIMHEGQLFGLANQILGTLAALGVLLLAASGLAMWWQRRPAERFAAGSPRTPLPRPVFLGTLALAALLPLLAATLVLLLAFDFVLSRRLPWLKAATSAPS